MKQVIRIGFSTTNSWSSALIRWVTRSRASHAWFSYHDETLGKVMVMHAVSHGMNVMPWKEFSKKNQIRAMYTAVPDMGEALKKISDRLGGYYDFMGIAGFFWVYLMRWFGRWIKNPLHSPGRLFCSEAVVLFMQYGKISRSEKLNAESTSPEDLWRFMHGHEQFKLIPASKFYKNDPREEAEKLAA